MGAFLDPALYKKMVGKLLTLTPSASLAVASNLPMVKLGIFLAKAPNSSKMGNKVLQCPHQGAYISMKTLSLELMTISLKVFPTMVLTASSVSVGISADFKKGLMAPLKTSVTNLTTFSLVAAVYMVNFCTSSLAKVIIMNLGEAVVSTPKNSANLDPRPSVILLSDMTTFPLRSVEASSMTFWKGWA